MTQSSEARATESFESYFPRRPAPATIGVFARGIAAARCCMARHNTPLGN